MFKGLKYPDEILRCKPEEIYRPIEFRLSNECYGATGPVGLAV
jgi:hypothetical protein